jgi:MFS family permease
LRFYWWRFNGAGFAIGLFVGMFAAILQRIFFPGLLEWYQFGFILSIAFIASIVGTFLTKPTDSKVVENFYIKTRPFGIWGPFKNSLDPSVRLATKKEHRNDIISIPFGMVWLMTLLLLPLLFMTFKWLELAITFVIFIISLVGLYFFWYRHLPPSASKQDKDEHVIPVGFQKSVEL